MLLSVGRLKAPRRIIAATGGGGGGAVDSAGRSGFSDSNHVHTINGLNQVFMIPNIHYIFQSVNDNAENYSVKDISFNSGNTTASHTFYLIIKTQLNTAFFHNDICVGAIQIFEGDTCVFAGGAEDTSIFTTSDDTVITNPPSGALTYHAIPSTGTNGQWSKKSSTNSANTGAADSIATTFQSTSNPLPNAGEEIIAQAASTDFIYFEATQTSEDRFAYLKFTTNLTLNTAHKFVFAYNLGVHTSDTGDDKDDNVGLYIENIP